MITQPTAMGILRPMLSVKMGLKTASKWVCSFHEKQKLEIEERGVLHEGDRDQAADLVESSKKTEHRALGVVEVLLPGLEVLDTVEEHSMGVLALWGAPTRGSVVSATHPS